MKEIIKLFNQALSILNDLKSNLSKQKEQYWNETLQILEKQSKIIDNIPYLKDDISEIEINTSEIFNPIDKSEILNLQIEENIDTFKEIDQLELYETLKGPCSPIENDLFEPLKKEEECLCDDKEEIKNNKLNIKPFEEEKLEQLIGEFPDNECIQKIKYWSNLLSNLVIEYTELKTWEGENYIKIKYWELFKIFFDNRELILKDLINNHNFKLLRNIIKNINITKISISNLLKDMSNELSLDVSNKGIFIIWKNKNKKEGKLFEWGSLLENLIKTIPEDDIDRSNKIMDFEKSIKKQFIDDNFLKIKENINNWTKKHCAEIILLKKETSTLNKWKKELFEINNSPEYLNIQKNLNRLFELEKLIEKTRIEMEKDLENSKCIVPEKNNIIPEENPEFRGNPNIESPNSLDKKWWIKFSSLASLINLIPVHWPVGILIPNPSGLLKIPMPIIWTPLVIIPIPTGIMVFFIAQCGICPSPVLFVWNSHPNQSLGSVNADSMSFPIAIRPSSNWKKGGGSKIIDTIPWISNIFSKFDPQPEITKQLPYIQDDMPSWERLSLKNPMLLLHLWDWASNGKKSCGFFENP